MDRDSIVDRIRKLLAMTERAGCTKAEAVQAALLAQKLIADNDVSSSELHGGSDDEPIEYVVSDAATRFRDWGKVLAAAVADAFRCKTIGVRSSSSRYFQPQFIGHSSDAKAAALVFGRLYAVGCDLGDAERKRARAEKRRRCSEEGTPEWWARNVARDAAARAYDSFTWGFLAGVKRELEKQSVALMIVVPRDVVEEFESIPTASRRLSTGRAASGAAYERGEGAGRDAVRSGRISGGDGSFALSA